MPGARSWRPNNYHHPVFQISGGDIPVPPVLHCRRAGARYRLLRRRRMELSLLEAKTRFVEATDAAARRGACCRHQGWPSVRRNGSGAKGGWHGFRESGADLPRARDRWPSYLSAGRFRRSGLQPTRAPISTLRLLLDTHIAIWAALDPDMESSRLNPPASPPPATRAQR